MQSTLWSPAAQAFDAAAESFDRRFGQWRSVAAQRRAVRTALAAVFPQGAHLLEIGGGTGQDALWLARRGRHVFLTDASPAMVRSAQWKLRERPDCHTAVVAAESLEEFALDRARAGAARFDGAFSIFAALNCVLDLTPVARGLAALVRPGGAVLLVLFGTCSPGEMLVELLRGRPRAAIRRFARGRVPARLGGHDFEVRYHRRHEVVRAMSPYFALVRRKGIGVFVPPSAAEPWISRHPWLLGALEAMDRAAARPLAGLGDHVLFHFERTHVEVT